MRIQDYTSCQHRLPGTPYIGCDPGCSLTPTETPCANPTYESCPRYRRITSAVCPTCGGVMFKDEAAWTIICPHCDDEYSATTIFPDKPWGRSPEQAVSG